MSQTLNTAFQQQAADSIFLIPGRKSLQRKPLNIMGNHPKKGYKARGEKLQGRRTGHYRSYAWEPQQSGDEEGIAQPQAGWHCGEETTATCCETLHPHPYNNKNASSSVHKGRVEKLSMDLKIIFWFSFSKSLKNGMLNNEMEMEIARPKLKQNSSSSGYSYQRGFNKFAHEMIKPAVNSQG